MQILNWLHHDQIAQNCLHLIMKKLSSIIALKLRLRNFFSLGNTKSHCRLCMFQIINYNRMGKSQIWHNFQIHFIMKRNGLTRVNFMEQSRYDHTDTKVGQYEQQQQVSTLTYFIFPNHLINQIKNIQLNEHG